MYIQISLGIVFFLVAAVLIRFYILGKQSQHMRVPLGIINGQLQPCSAKPNCVSSQAVDSEHRVEAFRKNPKITNTFDLAARVIREKMQGHVISQSGNYLHAEFRTKIFGFVDDVEILAHESSDLLEVRSASRVGYSDLGVNKKRVIRLRDLLKAEKIII